MEGGEIKGYVCYYSLLRAKTHPRSRLSELNPHVQECLLEGQLTSSKTDIPKERRDEGEEREKWGKVKRREEDPKP